MKTNMFGNSGPDMKAPLTCSDFKGKVLRQYGPTDSIREAVALAVEDVWPAPAFRENQQEAVVDVLMALYVEDNDVVLLNAPTGAGKSLILYAVMAVVEALDDKDSFFTTPLNALIDQVDDDDFIADEIISLKGKNNYDCIHPHDRGTPVDKAVCQRVSDFDCEYKSKCEYYGRKDRAQFESEVVTNLSYLMANSMIPDAVDSKFQPREVLEVDECQNIEDFAIQFVGFTVSSRAIPVVYDEISRPPRTDDAEKLAEWLESDVMVEVRRKLDEYEGFAELSEEQADNRDKLENFAQRCTNFLHDVKDHHWVAERDVDDGKFTVKFNPIFVGRFLGNYLWGQGHKVVMSSATMPRGDFLKEVGLDSHDVAEVNVPSTFPPERRPVITDHAVGKMTYHERDKTIPKMASKIAEMARHHEGERGFIHCHAYSIMENIYDALPADVKARTTKQDPDAREQSLRNWLDSDDQVFLSVAMDEGISLDGDKARWQVVAKAAYPNMSDARVEYRMDKNTMGGADWNWYSGKAAVNLQQAVGRGMRSKDDYCHTYILDTSAVTLIERNKHLFEDWFLSAVDVTPNIE